MKRARVQRCDMRDVKDSVSLLKTVVITVGEHYNIALLSKKVTNWVS